MLMAEPPPGLPSEMSAHLEHGFVHAGQALIASPRVMLSSFAHLFTHWHEQPSEVREAVLGRPVGVP